MVEASPADKAQTLSTAYGALSTALADGDHATVTESTSTILECEDSEKTDGARRAKLVSLIKRREFTEAMQFLNKHDTIKKSCMVEAAYIMHRQDLNKQAL